MLIEQLGRGTYRYACPNCDGPNTEKRLMKGLPCPRCLPTSIDGDAGIENIAKSLRRAGTLKRKYQSLAKLEEESNELIEYFKRILGSPAWGAQRTWARRLIRGDSFSIIAPTGMGKTTFGIISSLYLSCRKHLRSYLVFPTTTLVEMVYRRAASLLEKEKCSSRIIAFHSKMKKKEREEALKAFNNGDFDILITTASFARRYADKLSNYGFKLVFVDDVDAVLRSAKSVDAILKIIGFTTEDIELGLNLLKLQRRIARVRAEQQRLELLLERNREQSTRALEKLENLKNELNKLTIEYQEIKRKIEKKARKASTLIVSSATGRPRGARVKLFRVLLNFEAGGRGDIGLRRVIDSYIHPEDTSELYETVAELVVREFPDGTLVYVPIDHGVEGAERLAAILRERGVKADAFHSKKPLHLLDDFVKGEINVLVGVANYYGVMVRGIDLPERVKFSVFAGIPRHKFTIDVGYPSPSSILRLLGLLIDLPLREIAEEARKHIAKVRRIIRTLSPAALQMIAEKILEGRVEESTTIRTMWEAYNFLRNAMRDPEVWRHLSERKDIAVIEDKEKYILVPDAATYLQASGRTSRLYAGGITLGLSVVVVDDDRLLRGLIKRTQWMVDAQWRSLEEIDLEKVKKEIDEERKKVRRLLGGLEVQKDLVRTALLIVESPNKARTIAGFFGQPSIRLLPGGARAYEVATGDYMLTIIASGGHIYDLATEKLKEDLPDSVEAGEWVFGVYVLGVDNKEYHPIYTSIKKCLNCGYQFTEERDTCPLCGSKNIRDSRVIVNDLRRLAWEVDMVLIGTDPDTEGEKIGWDIALLLKPYSRKIMRLEFHEVTRRAILNALKNLRDFDQRLVDAQIVRRVEDRWIGFTLSPLLWCHFWPEYYCKKIENLSDRGEFRVREKERCKQYKYYYNLSAGRVQTPVLGWIIDRYEEAKEKINEYRLTINSSRILFTDLDIIGDLATLHEIVKPRKSLIEIDVKVELVEEKEEVVNPPPPYTTDTMIADANRYLGLGAPETMRLAQNLFELGLITYHRTDSTRVSDRGLQVAKEWLEEAFGELSSKLFHPRRWGEGGAHEAIRPTRPIDSETLGRLVEEGVLEFARTLTRAHYRLYDLIFRRFIASQMREAVVKRAKYIVTIYGHDIKLELERTISIGVEDKPETKGFTLIWPYIRKHAPLPVGIVPATIEFLRRISRIPLFTQGEVISLMKERGIGRPSTYAKIIETLFHRRYITRIFEDRLIPTIRGRLVHKYLTMITGGRGIEDDLDQVAYNGLTRIIDEKSLQSIPELISEERTRILEERMDKIESGEEDRVKVLDEVYSEISGVVKPIIAAYSGVDTHFSDCLRKYRGNRGLEPNG